MDTFIEQIVRKKKTAGEWALVALILVAAVIVCLAAWLFLGGLGIFFIAGAIFGAYWLITGTNKEFEYSVTNGDIDMDCIIAKRKRKRIVSVTGKKIEALLPYDAARCANAGYQRTVVAAPSDREPGLWMFSYHSKKNGHTLVIFQPEDRVLNALIAGLPKLVQMDTERTLRAKDAQ